MEKISEIHTCVWGKQCNVSIRAEDKIHFCTGYVYFVLPLEYLIKKPPVPTKWATVSLIKIKSCNALLRMLLVYIGSYLKSVLRYKLLILDTYRPDTLYLREQGCEDLWLFLEVRRVNEHETLVSTALGDLTTWALAALHVTLTLPSAVHRCAGATRRRWRSNCTHRRCGYFDPNLAFADITHTEPPEPYLCNSKHFYVQSNSVITSWKALNILCRYKRVSL
jgi:hypothetical protein